MLIAWHVSVELSIIDNEMSSTIGFMNGIQFEENKDWHNSLRNN